MNVPFADLKTQYMSIKDEMDSAIFDVINNSAFIGGNNLTDFEKSFAAFVGTSYCIGVSNGTSAIELALKALGIKPGDEVLVPANTFIATSEAVTAIGGRVKFVDVDFSTGLMTASMLSCGPNTKAIIPVHLYGQPCDMDPIIEFAKMHNLIILEDCAQAHGATYKGNVVPVTGNGTFSFYPGKNLGAYGDAGAIVTNSVEVANKVKMFRDHGRLPGDKYKHAIEASNYRMDALQARILSVKLKHLNEWTALRRFHAAHYKDNLNCGFIQELSFNSAVYHLFVILHPERDRLQKYLKELGIETGIHYPIPLHLQPSYNYLGHKVGDFPNSEKLCNEILSIPMFPEMSIEQLEYVCEKINLFK